jgi:hypothetical protein
LHIFVALAFEAVKKSHGMAKSLSLGREHQGYGTNTKSPSWATLLDVGQAIVCHPQGVY